MAPISLLTDRGRQILAARVPGDPPFASIKIVVGDGNGATYVPASTQTALVAEKWRGDGVATLVDTKIAVAATIPANVGGWTIRECGLLMGPAGAEELAVVSQYNVQYKPAAGENGASQLTIVMTLDYSGSAVGAFNISIGSNLVTDLTRIPFIAVDGLITTPPAPLPADGALYAVADNPTGDFAGKAGYLVERAQSAWRFKLPPLATVVRTPDGAEYEKQLASWVARSNYLRKNASDAVTLADATHAFENLQISPGAATGVSRELRFRGKDEVASGFVFKSLGPGQMGAERRNTTTGALIDTPWRLDNFGRVLARMLRYQDGADIADITVSGGAVEARNSAGTLLYRFPLDGSGQFVQRGGSLRQIATEDRQITAGTGLSGGGNLGADRSLAFDTVWGDGRYAINTRQMIAGTGLSGGGTLAADRTFAFDTVWGDARYAKAGRIVAYGELRKHLNNGGAAGPIATIRAFNCSMSVVDDLTVQVTFGSALPNTNYDVRGILLHSAPQLAQNVSGEFDYISTTRTQEPIPYQGTPRNSITVNGFRLTYPTRANATIDSVFTVFHLG